MPMPRRVVITGMGVVTGLGDTLERYWSGLCEGRSGVGPLTLFDTTHFKVHFGGQVAPAAQPARRVETPQGERLLRRRWATDAGQDRPGQGTGMHDDAEDQSRRGRAGKTQGAEPTMSRVWRAKLSHQPGDG